MKKYTVVALSLLFGFSTCPVAMADIYSDVTAIATGIADIYGVQTEMQEAQAVISEYNKIASDNAAWQYTLMSESWDELTKAYNVSRPTEHAFAFDSSSRYTELWSPDELDDALQSASGGNSERYQELKTAYAKKNPTLVDTAASDIDNEALVSNSYTQKAESANTVLATSNYSYGDINQRIKNLQDLLKRVDGTYDENGEPMNPNEKSAIDLNTRMTAEAALIQVEILRLETIRANMEATQVQDQINHETMGKKLLGVTV